MSPSQTIYTRKVNTVVDLLSDVGGSISIIVLIFELISSQISGVIYTTELVKSALLMKIYYHDVFQSFGTQRERTKRFQ